MIYNNVKIQSVEAPGWVCLGTPKQLIAHSYELKEDKQRFCFDFDGTLVTFPFVPGDYSTVEPITKNIDFLKSLYNSGHYIIIYTARRMRTHNGDVEKVIADIGQVTKDSLEKFGIPYHELIFGKPYAHHYFDDLAISAFDDLSKSTGHYADFIEARDFNQVEFQQDVVVKTSTASSFEGECFYYENIDSNISDLFPRFELTGTHPTRVLKMERVSGVVGSNLIGNKLMTPDHLELVMKSLNRIHESDSTDGEINIYENYLSKVVQRYASYDYSRFDGHDEVFKLITDGLNEYERCDIGRKCKIHGDPVLSNIIFDSRGGIKLIDPRGKVGKVLTTSGDVNYDWAKLYQSLCGYDFVLTGRTPDSLYLKNLREAFMEAAAEYMDDESIKFLPILTASLYFSLIPLHDNAKCFDYFDIGRMLVTGEI